MLKTIVKRALNATKNINREVIVKTVHVGVAIFSGISIIKAVTPSKPVIKNPIFMVINNYYVRGPKHAKINN